MSSYDDVYKFRVRTKKNGKKHTIQKHSRGLNAIKQAVKNKELGYWAEGLIGKTWYELKI